MSPSQIPKTSQKEIHGETSLAVQWLRLCTCTAEGAGSIPGWGTKILPAARCGQKKKKKKKHMGHSEPHSEESNMPRLGF